MYTAILIVTRGRVQALRKTLQSLAEQTAGPANLAVFILDSGSPERLLSSYKQIADNFAGTFGLFNIWRTDRNIGPVAGFRFLAEQVPENAEYLVKLDDEIGRASCRERV